MVPVFDVSFVGLIISLIALQWSLAAVCAGLIVLSMVSQKAGHSLEQTPPKPFLGFGDFLRRWFTEQYWTFPRFVVSAEFRLPWSQGSRDSASSGD